MPTPQDSWRTEVATAATTGDADTLRELFADGHVLFGEDVHTEWARALSALDGTAITG